MKRLLLICGAALLMAPAAMAGKPASAAPTLALTSCVSPCTMAVDPYSASGFAIDVTFGGSGYNPRTTYAACLSGTAFAQVCYGISSSHIAADGTLSGVGWTHLENPGSYSFGIYTQLRQGLSLVGQPVLFTLVAP